MMLLDNEVEWTEPQNSVRQLQDVLNESMNRGYSN